MKALSVKQPWASLIARAGRVHKTIEVRTWSTNFRGWLLIVASKRDSDGMVPPPRVWGLPPAAQWPRGAAVAVARLVDVRPAVPGDEQAAQCPIDPGDIAWCMEYITPIHRPFPVRGSLGLYEVDTLTAGALPVLPGCCQFCGGCKIRFLLGGVVKCSVCGGVGSPIVNSGNAPEYAKFAIANGYDDPGSVDIDDDWDEEDDETEDAL